MVASEKINVAIVILEQYTLNKLWQDVKDVYFDKPIRHANEVRVDVMLSWEVIVDFLMLLTLMCK